MVILAEAIEDTESERHRLTEEEKLRNELQVEMEYEGISVIKERKIENMSGKEGKADQVEVKYEEVCNLVCVKHESLQY